MTTTSKQDIVNALHAHISQRSGRDFRNYQAGNWKASREAFNSDYRPMLRDGKIAREMLREIERRESITADDLLAGFRAFSERLSYNAKRKECDYCTGQYFPTEYRRAAVVVLATVLWDYMKASTCDRETDKSGDWRKRFERNVRNAFPRRLARIICNL